jgi:hypothetical protein
MTACDVLVAGGGSAGVAAAVAAARAGAKTILLERGGMLGGMGAAAFVHTLCGLYRIRPEPGAEFANEGFAREFARALVAAGGAGEPVRMGRLDVLPHDPVAFAVLADRFCGSAGPLEVWCHAELVGADGRDGAIRAVRVACAGRVEEIEAAAYVDATGDGGLGFAAGAAFRMEESGRLQRPAFVALLGGLAAGALADDGRLRAAHALAEGVRAGDLPAGALGAAFRPGIGGGCNAFLTVDLEGSPGGGEPWDPLSARCRAAAEREGRRLSLAVIGHLARRLPPWAHARVAAWPSRLGVRESRRLTGVHELSGDEVLRGERFPDGVVEVAWPMELRERPTGPKLRFPEGPEPARVPLRSLRHRDFANLWMAGRCLSASHEALAAVRVMGTCLATGEIAGLAAAAGFGADCGWQTMAARVTGDRDKLPRAC